MRVVVSECDDFLVARYVLTTDPKANQNPSFTSCSDLRVTANQIITWPPFTRLATVNHRRPFSGLYTGYHCLAKFINYLSQPTRH